MGENLNQIYVAQTYTNWHKHMGENLNQLGHKT